VDRSDELQLDYLAPSREGGRGDALAPAEVAERAAVTAGHFFFIPAVLIVGIVIGWILGSRAARDAYASELKRREERRQRKAQG
jgi:hypothetical protein